MELHLAGCTLSELETWILSLQDTPGLGVALKRASRTRLGSTHWHLVRGRGSGTLEITWLDRDDLIIFSVHDNRRGNWAGEALESVANKARLELS